MRKLFVFSFSFVIALTQLVLAKNAGMSCNLYVGGASIGLVQKLTMN